MQFFPRKKNTNWKFKLLATHQLDKTYYFYFHTQPCAQSFVAAERWKKQSWHRSAGKKSTSPNIYPKKRSLWRLNSALQHRRDSASYSAHCLLANHNATFFLMYANLWINIIKLSLLKLGICMTNKHFCGFWGFCPKEGTQTIDSGYAAHK